MTTATKPQLLQAFEGTNTKVPVWFMRQAGRYLPEYQAVRKEHSLEEMFGSPEIAAEVTCQPIDILDVDAAILFADILTLPGDMGFNITFDKKTGPKIANRIADASDIDGIHDFENLTHVADTVKLIKQRLSTDIPLIGFAGGPFTVLTYLIEGGSSLNFFKTHAFIRQNQEAFHGLMQKLTTNTINYLKLQKDAGIDVFQIFDSWAGQLRPADFSQWVLPYAQQIFQEVDLPSIYFVRNTNHLLPLMDQSYADFLSVDQTVLLGHHTTISHTKKGIQGNLFNGLLYADRATLEKEVRDVLIGARKHDRYIFNLSHGVFPNVNVEQLKFIVKLVHEFNWHA